MEKPSRRGRIIPSPAVRVTVEYGCVISISYSILWSSVQSNETFCLTFYTRRTRVFFVHPKPASLIVAARMTSKSTCDIDDGVRTSLKEFRFRKSQKNAALIMKVDRPKQTICLDEIIEDVQIEELQEAIPSHEPRYIVYSYKMTHDDGRISYPMCFIFYTPRGIQMELQVLYASMKLVLQKEVELTRCYEVRELEELTEEWLREKLSR